jgi:hypothetical protein
MSNVGVSNELVKLPSDPITKMTYWSVVVWSVGLLTTAFDTPTLDIPTFHIPYYACVDPPQMLIA